MHVECSIAPEIDKGIIKTMKRSASLPKIFVCQVKDRCDVQAHASRALDKILLMLGWP